MIVAVLSLEFLVEGMVDLDNTILASVYLEEFFPNLNF